MIKLRYIEALRSCPTVFLACSGGIDSMVLLHILQKEKVQLHVLHCNFKLRGKDSDNDAQFIENYCANHNITLSSKAFDVLGLKRNENQSIQKLARDLRYSWFETMLDTIPGSLLCTAHHFEDSHEQLWIRLLSSGNLLTCQGIPASRDRIHRPMIDMAKADIQTYAKKHALSWREDQSNFESKYTRNAIRIDLIPLMEKIDPRARSAAKKLMSEVERLQSECLLQINKHFGKEIRQHHFFISNDMWGDALTIWKEVLLAYWKNSAQGISEIDKLFEKGSVGKFVSFADFYVMREATGLWMGRHSLDNIAPLSIKFEKLLDGEVSENLSPNSYIFEDNEDLFLQAVQYKDVIFQPRKNNFRSVKKIFNDNSWMHHRRKSAIGLYQHSKLICLFSSHDSQVTFHFEWGNQFFSKNLSQIVAKKNI
jgi:tRNA(Ile)-lysidine synthetase-like protein